MKLTAAAAAAILVYVATVTAAPVPQSGAGAGTHLARDHAEQLRNPDYVGKAVAQTFGQAGHDLTEKDELARRGRSSSSGSGGRTSAGPASRPGSSSSAVSESQFAPGVGGFSRPPSSGSSTAGGRASPNGQLPVTDGFAGYGGPGTMGANQPALNQPAAAPAFNNERPVSSGSTSSANTEPLPLYRPQAPGTPPPAYQQNDPHPRPSGPNSAPRHNGPTPRAYP